MDLCLPHPFLRVSQPLQTKVLCQQRSHHAARHGGIPSAAQRPRSPSAHPPASTHPGVNGIPPRHRLGRDVNGDGGGNCFWGEWAEVAVQALGVALRQHVADVVHQQGLCRVGGLGKGQHLLGGGPQQRQLGGTGGVRASARRPLLLISIGAHQMVRTREGYKIGHRRGLGRGHFPRWHQAVGDLAVVTVGRAVENWQRPLAGAIPQSNRPL